MFTNPPHPKKENICSQKDLYMNVDGKFTQNSPNLKITQMSTNRYIDTQIRKYSYARLQLNNKKKQTNDTWGKMDESPNHQPAWKKLGRKEYILYDSILEWPNGWPCCWWKGDSLQKRLVGVIGMPYILSVNILGLHTVKVRRLHSFYKGWTPSPWKSAYSYINKLIIKYVPYFKLISNKLS